MIIASFFEVISIGSVIPFLAALTNPDKIFSSHLVSPLINLIGVKTADQIVFPIVITFCVLAFFSGFVRLILLKTSIRVSFAIGADLSCAIYERTLYQPYKVHISRNTSEVITGIYSKTNLIIYSVILPILTIISTSILLIAIVLTLIYVDPLICFSAFLPLVLYILLLQSKPKIKKLKIAI